jgi:dCMP deaminase
LFVPEALPESCFALPPRFALASSRGRRQGPAAVMNEQKRASWDEYFMNIAREVASRATCDRKHVGAVLVRDKTILSTGYNGSIRGLPHCSEVGHMMEDGHCVATVHAEANAIIQAAKNGVAIEGATIYTTASPCWPCFKLIANSGCRRIVFGEFYRDSRVFDFAKQLGIELVELKVPEKPDLAPTDTGPARPVVGGS